MNTTTNTELAEVEKTDLATLPPAARAAVALKSEQTRKDLAELAAQSANIVAVLNADGREQAHRIGMTLKNARVAIEKVSKAAREDATAFSKACIAEEKALIALVEPEETRVLKLRDEWDDKIEAEKQAKIAAERARVEAIQADIDRLRAIPSKLVGKASGDLEFARKDMLSMVVDEERFAEFTETARTVVVDVIARIELMWTAELEREAAAREAEEARKAEAARIEAERAELARLRAEQAERERLAKIESDRVAAEQAAERKRLADLAAAQEAELRRQREAEAARVRAEQEARDREASEQRRQIEAQQAALAAQQAAFAREQEEARQCAEAAARLESDHAEALPMNVQFDADLEAERTRLQLLADLHRAHHRPESFSIRDEQIDAGTDPLSDAEIIENAAATFSLTIAEAVERLASIDFVAARERLAA